MILTGDKHAKVEVRYQFFVFSEFGNPAIAVLHDKRDLVISTYWKETRIPVFLFQGSNDNESTFS